MPQQQNTPDDSPAATLATRVPLGVRTSWVDACTAVMEMMRRYGPESWQARAAQARLDEVRELAATYHFGGAQ